MSHDWGGFGDTGGWSNDHSSSGHTCNDYSGTNSTVCEFNHAIKAISSIQSTISALDHQDNNHAINQHSSTTLPMDNVLLHDNNYSTDNKKLGGHKSNKNWNIKNSSLSNNRGVDDSPTKRNPPYKWSELRITQKIIFIVVPSTVILGGLFITCGFLLF